jgi:uracil phosphoribosyltransferase
MIIHSLKNSVLNTYITQIRDKEIQKDAMRFRKNIERIGSILAYELSKNLPFSEKEITTPLGNKKMQVIDEKIVLCSILRAGLPLHQGVLNVFDQAENAFISAYRKHHKDNEKDFTIEVEYFASPSLEEKTLILIDPMLATGSSMVAVYKALKQHGIPKKIHIVSVIGSLQGVEYIEKYFPKSTELWISAIDDKLNDKGYIIPGLGDAGDLAFGNKL